MTTIAPNRKAVEAEEIERAAWHMRDFDPHRYAAYYSRVYNVRGYLDQVGIYTICDLVERGNGMYAIAEKLDISTTALRNWVNSRQEYRTLVNEAYRYAGDAYAFKAEAAFENAVTKEQIAVAGKLAEHYRWMASRLDKERYGEVKEGKQAPAPTILNLVLTPQTQELKTINQAPIAPPAFMKLAIEAGDVA